MAARVSMITSKASSFSPLSLSLRLSTTLYLDLSPSPTGCTGVLQAFSRAIKNPPLASRYFSWSRLSTSTGVAITAASRLPQVAAIHPPILTAQRPSIRVPWPQLSRGYYYDDRKMHQKLCGLRRMLAMEAYIQRARRLDLTRPEDVKFLTDPGYFTNRSSGNYREIYTCNPVPLFPTRVPFLDRDKYYYCLATRRMVWGPPVGIWADEGIQGEWIYRLYDQHKDMNAHGGKVKPRPRVVQKRRENELIALPEHVVVLGDLVLASPIGKDFSISPAQGLAREDWSDQTLELTGYLVALDFLNPQLPLWIVREDQYDDLDFWHYDEYTNQILWRYSQRTRDTAMLFDGNLSLQLEEEDESPRSSTTMDGDSKGEFYGAACIMASFRHLGQPQANYQEAVNLVAKSAQALRPYLDYINTHELLPLRQGQDQAQEKEL